MKKRIISIALVVVMIVAMIPATLISASAIAWAGPGIDVHYHDEEIIIDAQMDDIYADSELVTEKSVYGDKTKTGFDAYFSATESGLYVFATITDPTIGYEYMKYNNEGNTCGNQDKIQVYFAGANKSNDRNYFEIGYYGNNVDGDTYTPEEGLAVLNHVNTSGIDKAKCQYATKILKDADNFDEPYAWIAEFYIPWDAIAVKAGDEAPYGLKVVVQANNDDWTLTDPSNVKSGKRTDRHYCYSGYNLDRVSSAWSTVGNYFSLLNYDVVKKPAAYTYNTPVTTGTIQLDGKLDDIYLNGSKISDNYQNQPETPVHFTTYTAATLAGLYLWTEVEDLTMNNIADTNANSGDYVQYYLDWTRRGVSHEETGMGGDLYRNSNESFFGGWVAVDYEGNIAAANNLGSFVKPNAKTAVIKYENPEWDGTDTETQYVGFSVETFIPWSEVVKDAIGARDASVHLGIGLEVANDTTYNGADDRQATGYDVPGGNSHYNTYEKLPDMKLIFDEAVPEHHSLIADTVTSVTLDGKNTDGEYDNSTVVHVNRVGGGSADEGDIYRVTLTDDAIYVLLENIDNTPCYNWNDNGYTTHSDWLDYIDFGVTLGDDIAAMFTFYRSEEFEGVCTPRVSVNNRDNDRWINYAVAQGKATTVFTDSANGWTVELKLALTAEERAAITAGKFDVGFAAQYQDRTGAESRSYTYSASTSIYSGNQQNGSSIGAFNFVEFTNRDSVEAISVNEVSVSLGESIDLNLYATLPAEATDSMVRVTFNEKEYYLNAKKTEVAGEYKFTFENIAPQAIGDVIVADLIIFDRMYGPTTVSLKKAEDGFTVANYLNAIKGAEDGKYDDVIDALLLYGAAAQQYTNYKTDALVADLATLVAPTMNKSVKEVDSALDNARFAAAGVHYANINKIFVKVEATDIADITFTATKNGAPIALELAEIAEGVYIAYTDGIKATEFGDVYTFTITDGTAASQTLTYSVYSYAEAMQANAKNPNTKTLVNALYNYGVAAEDLK